MKGFKEIIHLKIIFFLFFSYNVQSQNFDIKVLDKLNNTDSVSFGFKSMVGVTHSVLPVSLALPMGFYIKGMADKDRKLKRQALNWAITFAGTSAITAWIKISADRDRPFTESNLIIPKVKTHDQSYPSGHTSSAFAIATTLSLYYPKWYIIIPSYGWAGTVAYSRMYLGVHYPSDVIGGMAVGIGTAYLSKKINDKLLSKKRKELIPAE